MLTDEERDLVTFIRRNNPGAWEIALINMLDRLTQTPSTASVREDAIEAAAVVVDCAAAGYESAGFPSTHWKNIASAIRALKSPSPPVSGKEG